ncbi:MAG: hypothetical protein ACPGUV_02870 [Polyangiales bacterium]
MTPLLLSCGGSESAAGAIACDPSDPAACSTGQVCQDGFCIDEGLVRPTSCANDADGDGYGEGCALGPDCDDSNPLQGNLERCDDRADNDCDGNIDEAGLDACACDLSCNSSPIGNPGLGGSGFDLNTNPSDGLGLDPNGNLVLSSLQINTSYIWIANTRQGTVSKVNTVNFEEEGRYAVGSASRYNYDVDGDGNMEGNFNSLYGFFNGTDPSRTSVDTFGRVFVANRNGGSVTAISPLGADCPDTNGDGVITTSTAGDDVLPWDHATLTGMSADDCILWHTDLPGNPNRVRAVAAQCTRVGVDVPRIDCDVWVGDFSGQRLFKLDGDTGEILIETPAPCRTYGFALDGSDPNGFGNLWVSCRDSGRGLGRVDTSRCTDDTSCDVSICVAADAEDDSCDDAIKARIPIPNNDQLYGITVDFNQNVWLGSSYGGTGSHDVFRYRPGQASGSRWDSLDGATLGAAGVSNRDSTGIAADGRGFVYAARFTDEVLQIDADTMEAVEVPGTNNYDCRGMAVDAQDKLWCIGTNRSTAAIFTPTDTLGQIDGNVQEFSGLDGPYTYSDMTGQQLRLATNDWGYFRYVFDGCNTGLTRWTQMVWDADVPSGTSLEIFARVADDRQALSQLGFNDGWIRLAVMPPDSSPADVESALSQANLSGNVLEIEVQMRQTVNDPNQAVSPVLRFLDVGHRCNSVI